MKKKPLSLAADERNLRNHILPAMGRLKVSAITRADVVRFHQSMKAKPGAANRCLALLSKMFNLAEKWGIRPDGTNHAKIEVLTKDLAVCVEGEASNNAPANAPETDDKETKRGPLVYRQPGAMYLTLCRTDSCKDPANVISRSTHMLPQAGVKAVLPLVNEMFDSNVLKASFFPSGGLASFDYIAEAQAEAASGSVANLAGVARQGVEDIDNAEIAKLKIRKEELELQNQLMKLRQERDGL